MTHRLDPLLRPASVAIVGASAKPDSLGYWCIENLLRGKFPGTIYLVNPRYTELRDLRCYASLGELPHVPDLVVFGVSAGRIESLLDAAIDIGVPAAVIMSPLALDDDTEPRLETRIRQKILDADMLVCGANGMGFYNIRDHVWACGFDSTQHEAPGSVSLISHSGSGMSGIVDCEQRLRFNLAVSTGNELSVTMDQYLDFALDLPETRVVGLFIETARNPAGFSAALAKAASRNIPVVAIKVGKTERSAKLTISHSGAIAGDDAAYEALFDRFGVQRVRDMDELATTLIMFAEMQPVVDGGLVSLHDSGGERQLFCDLADDAGVPLTELCDNTTVALEAVLDAELPAINPLDAWSRGGPDADNVMTSCLTLLLSDPGAAMGVVVHDRAPEGRIYPGYLDYLRRAHADTGKPVALVAARQGTGHDELVVSSTHAGFPVLDDVSAFLVGARALLAYRDFAPPLIENSMAAKGEMARQWLHRLERDSVLDEETSLQLLRDFGLPAIRQHSAGSESEVRRVASEIGYPLVLKTAAAGVYHKTDRQGVCTDLRSESQLMEKYRDLCDRLGPDVVLSPMAAAGVEMMLGMRLDPQFGPVVLFGFGGVLAETSNDVIFALPPFDSDFARRKLDALRLRSVLDGMRGSKPVDADAFCKMASDFSMLVELLGSGLREVDVNPVIVSDEGCIAVDALIAGGARRRGG